MADVEIRFEDALRRLEETVTDLEGGELGLDDSLARYEEGVRLLSRCRSILDGAERRVALLTGVDEGGNPETAPFDASATLTVTADREPAPGARTPRRRPKPPADGEGVPF